jgi:signal transduction histidine kinase
VSPGSFEATDAPNIRQIGRVPGDAVRYSRLFQREHQVVDRLQQIEQWRTAFLRTMAHELRTPLGQIVGFTDLLSQSVTGLNEREARYLENARTAASRMSVLVERSFELIRLFAADVQLEIEPVDVAGLLRQLTESFRYQFEAHNITVQCESDRATVQGDARRLRQALSVLLENAVKYAPEGGVISLVTRHTPDGIEIEVADTGPGVPAEMKELIFSGQAEDVLIRRQGGAGMGLLMGRRIAELHGGQLRLIDSEVGARFVLSLPRGE